MDFNESFIELEESMKNWCDGFFILFDIIDSTTRKKKYEKDWYMQTQTIAKVIKSFYDSLIIELRNFEVDDTYSLKNMGDGFMMFFKMKERKDKSFPSENHTEIAKIILDRIKELLDTVEDNASILYDLQLKTVITFLTDIYFYSVGGDGSSKDDMVKHDILGRGVDFLFRLEKFGGASHYCINKMFYQCIEKYSDNKMYDSIKTSKSVKGWSNPQEFYILTNNEMINGNTEELTEVSIDNSSVRVELLKYYINGLETKMSSGSNDISKYYIEKDDKNSEENMTNES